MGNSRISFRATTVGLVINTLLDPILIFGIGNIPGFGVAGAAIATTLAQGIVMMMFIFSCKSDMVLFHKIKVLTKPIANEIKQIIKIGLPISVQSMVFTAISMVISRLIANFGDSAVAVQKVGSQIESISWMTADGFSAAVNSFVAQNYGAGNHDRLKKGYKISMIVVAIWGIFSTLLLVLFPKVIFSIFISETDVLAMGITYLRILGLSQLFMCVEIATQGAFGGMGKTIPPSIVSMIFTSARIPLAIILCITPLRLNGIWWSISISSFIKGVLLVIWFLLYLRKYDKDKLELVNY